VYKLIYTHIHTDHKDWKTGRYGRTCIHMHIYIYIYIYIHKTLITWQKTVGKMLKERRRKEKVKKYVYILIYYVSRSFRSKQLVSDVLLHFCKNTERVERECILFDTMEIKNLTGNTSDVTLRYKRLKMIDCYWPSLRQVTAKRSELLQPKYRRVTYEHSAPVYHLSSSAEQV
jgi:hypothetical protein